MNNKKKKRELTNEEIDENNLRNVQYLFYPRNCTGFDPGYSKNRSELESYEELYPLPTTVLPRDDD